MADNYDFVINCTDGVCDETQYDYGINLTELVKAEAEGTLKETAEVLHVAAMADVKEYAKFVMALNHLLWDRYNKGDEKTARIYDALWRKYDGFAYKHFKGKDLDWYIRYLD